MLGSGGPDGAPYREFVLSRIAAAHRIVLVDDAVPDWTAPYVAGHIPADLSDTAAVAAAVKEVVPDNRITGVMTYLEHHVVAAAEIAQLLDLPGSSPEAMAACRDKALTRQRLADARPAVPSAHARQATSADRAVEHANAIGYPVVVKPRSLAASVGVVRADNDAEVRAAYEQARAGTLHGLEQYGPRGVLVEEFLEGTEISVETAVLGPGQAHMLAVTRKAPSPAGTTQESGHIVDANDPLLDDEDLAHVISAAVGALGLTCGVLCIEVMLTVSGPRIVEINGRLGGDLLPLLVQHALGIDLAQIAAALATGTTPQLRATRSRAAGIRFAYPTVTGTLDHLRFPPGLTALPFVDRVVLSRSPGEHVVAPPHSTIADRLAHWVVTADNAPDCELLLDEVATHLDITVNRPVRAASCSR
ncbi:MULTISPECIES: ATP-grasp domain-containing protein [Streptomyces]|uniref:ATP-grasp domain-containing protein n=2 Tax=Streptomyces TaxID=1883 RepID=A0ABV9IJQ3_9ACTN